MLAAHSLTEAQLYLKITACQKCDPRSTTLQKSVRHAEKLDAPNITRVNGECPSCGATQGLDFAIESAIATVEVSHPPAINQTEVRSQIIDVGQWLTLSQLFIQESRSEPDRSRARILNLQAAQCLDEALKFYDDRDNDLPPADAFYCEPSRHRFREAPQQFSRSRLVGQRRKLPVAFNESKSKP